MKNPLLRIVLLIIILFIIFNNFLFFPHNILSWDVFGYYLYLPLKFIYHDLDLHDKTILPAIIEKYHNTITFYQVMDLWDGHSVMKYSMGLSIFYAPFFFAGHLIAVLTGSAADGFSAPYQYSVFVGSIIYSILGILILAKILLRYLSPRITAITLILIVSATNYIIHVTMYGQNANSHSILFMMYALIIWLTLLWHETYKLKYAVFLAFACGLTILSRPSEIICLSIPFFWGASGFKPAIEKLKILIRYRYHILIFIFILVLIGSFQFVYWKHQTGKFLFYSYGGNAGEGFEFFHPNIGKVLFSFRKGWLIYTPVMIFAIMGFIIMFRKNRAVFTPLFIYFIFNLFIVSSWSNWWYAQSFSQRSLIPSYPVMAISLGYFLDWLLRRRSAVRIPGISMLALVLALNIFQTIQYHRGIISGDRMTKAYYFAVFGRMHPDPEAEKLLLFNRSFEGGENFYDEEIYTGKTIAEKGFESGGTGESAIAHTGKHSFRLDSITAKSPAVAKSYNELTSRDHAWVRVTAFVYPASDTSQNLFTLTIHFLHHGYPYKMVDKNSGDFGLIPDQWNRISVDYLTPEVRRRTDTLKIYFMNRGQGTAFIDDMKVEVFEENEKQIR